MLKTKPFKEVINICISFLIYIYIKIASYYKSGLILILLAL
jgi:hypothetical protein